MIGHTYLVPVWVPGGFLELRLSANEADKYNQLDTDDGRRAFILDLLSGTEKFTPWTWAHLVKRIFDEGR